MKNNPKNKQQKILNQKKKPWKREFSGKRTTSTLSNPCKFIPNKGLYIVFLDNPFNF